MIKFISPNKIPGLVARLYLAVFLSFGSMNLFASDFNPDDYLGRFEGEYRQFFNTVQFSVTLEASGLLTLDHPKYGQCKTKARDGYRLYEDNGPLVLKNAKWIVSLNGILFCDRSWYQIILEMEKSPDLSGAPIRAAILLQDSKLSTVLDKQITLRKVVH